MTATTDGGLTRVRIGVTNLQGSVGNLAGSLLYNARFNWGVSTGSFSALSARVSWTPSGGASGSPAWDAALDPTSISLSAENQNSSYTNYFAVWGTYAYSPYGGACGQWENSLGVGRGDYAYGGYCNIVSTYLWGSQTTYTTTLEGIAGANAGAGFSNITTGANSGSRAPVGTTSISYQDYSCGFFGLGRCTYAIASPLNYTVDAGIFNMNDEEFTADGSTPAGAAYYYEFTSPNRYDPRDITSVSFADYNTADGSSLACSTSGECAVLSDVVATPEPASLTLVATGWIGVLGTTLRRRRNAARREKASRGNTGGGASS